LSNIVLPAIRSGDARGTRERGAAGLNPTASPKKATERATMKFMVLFFMPLPHVKVVYFSTYISGILACMYYWNMDTSQ
jgi:hypothetical protein